MAKMGSDEKLSKGEKKETMKIADKEARKEVGRHEKEMHSSKGVGLLKPGSAAKLAAGGVTSKAMMTMGRNLARVANQRNTGRGR